MSYNPNDPNTWQTPPPPGYSHGQPNYPPPGYQQPPPGGYQQHYPPPGYQQFPPGGYQPYSNTFGMPIDLPQSSSAQTCGIIGIILFFNIIGIVLNIVAISQGSSAMRLYEQRPGVYTESSYRRAKTGKTCGIVGISLLGFVIVVVLMIVAANA